jgi:hypothetical protein
MLYSSGNPASSGSPVDGSTSLLVNFMEQVKEAIGNDSGESRVNDTYTRPGDVAVVMDGTGMMKSSVRPASSLGCMMMDTSSSTTSGTVFDTLNYMMIRMVVTMRA